MALLIGLGVGYLLGVNGVGQKTVPVPQQQNFGPGSQNQGPPGQGPQQGGNMQQPLNQGKAPAGAPGGQSLPQQGTPNQGGQSGQQVQ